MHLEMKLTPPPLIVISCCQVAKSSLSKVSSNMMSPGANLRPLEVDTDKSITQNVISLVSVFHVPSSNKSWMEFKDDLLEAARTLVHNVRPTTTLKNLAMISAV